MPKNIETSNSSTLLTMAMESKVLTMLKIKGVSGHICVLNLLVGPANQQLVVDIGLHRQPWKTNSFLIAKVSGTV